MGQAIHLAYWSPAKMKIFGIGQNSLKELEGPCWGWSEKEELDSLKKSVCDERI